MPTLAHFQMDYAELGLSCPLQPIFKWIILNWVSHAHYGPLRWTLVLFKGFTTCLIHLESFLYTSVLLSPVDKRNQTNNSRKINSPLNTRVEEIRVEIPFEELVCYVLCVNRVYMFSFFIKVSSHFMHTCIHNIHCNS